MNSNSTQPDEPQLEGYGAEQWRQILHNASLKAASDPANADTHRAMVQRALINLSTLNQQQNTADMTQAGQDLSGGLQKFAALIPGGAGIGLLPQNVQSTLGAGAVGFGQGASLGAVQPPVVGGQSPIKMAHGTAVTVGDVAGNTALGALASPLAAGLSPAVGAGLIGGTMGAARGGIGTAVAKSKGETNPGLTGDAGTDAVLGGLTGLVGGAAAGKVLGPVVKGIGTVGKNLVALFAKRAAAEGTQLGAEGAVDAAEATVRRYLAKNNYSPELIDKIVEQSRPLWAKGVPPQEGTFNNLSKMSQAEADAVARRMPGPPTTRDPLETPTFLRRGGYTPTPQPTFSPTPFANEPGYALPPHFSQTFPPWQPQVPTGEVPPHFTETFQPWQPGGTVSQSGGQVQKIAEPLDVAQELRTAAGKAGRALTATEKDAVIDGALKGQRGAPQARFARVSNYLNQQAGVSGPLTSQTDLTKASLPQLTRVLTEPQPSQGAGPLQKAVIQELQRRGIGGTFGPYQVGAK